ncbi:alpha/beta fold hydrolase [Streptomyces sp. NBC_00687]|uniref:alpha/beta fold hydrolase n=1 Tax=Streptomyces sp. NBC_00687 TaxID=2975807 RepID=UPI0022509BE4|nr:alpha/beta hydrolase [Streptomyces sp. NBC_00687]MCX4912032.1 alpha/beta hydrolase [Streptomyces sp. NBC_00687]
MSTTPTPIDSAGQAETASKPRRWFSRRAFVGGAAAAAAGVSLAGVATIPAAASQARRTPAGFGSVATAPRLPAAFSETFRSRFVQANGIRQHAVVGGDGPPLLLVHGWPQNWYAWRLLMPELAKKYTVVAVDQRGIGLTEKPATGYDTRTLANDLVALMDALGHRGKFAVVGHDTGMVISYALAADHPDRVARVALAEVPGPPGVVPSPPMFIDAAHNNRLWHIPFNRVDNELTEKLVQGREDIFFGYEFDIQGGELPEYAREYYISLLSNPESLRGNFQLYRSWDATLKQNEARAKTRLPMPVLAIGGADSWGPGVGVAMKDSTTLLETAVIPGAAHWVAEQAPKAMLDALGNFLAPYRARR